MDLQRAGGTFRAVRIRRGWRQIDVARRAGVARTTASRIERGHADELSLRTLEQVARALDIRLDLLARWRGGDLDRLLSAGHSALAGTVSELLTRTGDWQVAHEVTFGVYGERGAIDILAWHASSRALLVVELKTEIVDVGALVGQVDRYRRLAPGVARERGWQASVFGCWVVVAEGPTNRRHVTTHRALLRNAFPDDRRSIRTWLQEPRGTVAALSFLSYDRQAITIRRTAGVKRVRPRRATRTTGRRPGRASAERAPCTNRDRDVGPGVQEDTIRHRRLDKDRVEDV